MISNLLIICLVVLNLILMFFLYKKNFKKILYKSKIDEIDVTDIHEIFCLDKISENLKGPKKDVIIKSFSISPDNKVIGMTSDYEAWILSSLSKISKNIFEFGTCSGKTTYLMGLNSSNDTNIFTITLDPNDIKEITKKEFDNKVSFRNLINESIYNKFLFSGKEIEKKIKVIFQNSLDFETINYENKMDLIFIDGGHTYSVVKNDSEKSFQMLSSKGIVLWHDYVPGKRSAKDVVRYIDEISKTKKIYKIKNTSLCIFMNN
tara:strand:- start:3855 stop:4640 length:786 start_codon:yes stop_codon:yes gene_type:complete